MTAAAQSGDPGCVRRRRPTPLPPLLGNLLLAERLSGRRRCELRIGPGLECLAVGRKSSVLLGEEWTTSMGHTLTHRRSRCTASQGGPRSARVHTVHRCRGRAASAQHLRGLPYSGSVSRAVSVDVSNPPNVERSCHCRLMSWCCLSAGQTPDAAVEVARDVRGTAAGTDGSAHRERARARLTCADGRLPGPFQS